MLINAGGLPLEVAHGVTAREVVAFVAAHGGALPERPWCGPVQLSPTHAAGRSPLVAFASLTGVPGPDARPDPGLHLAIAAGPDAGAVATVADGLVVGRGAGSAAGPRLAIDDPQVSASHVRVDRGRARDAGSRNGLRADGQRVRRARRLTPGQVLAVGASLVAVRAEEEAAKDPPSRRGPAVGLATGGAAALSMAAFAIMTGHWQFAVVALVLPAIGLAPRLISKLRPAPPHPLLDVTATLGCPPLPPGPLAISGPAGLMRAVTLAVGRPPASARQWEDWMAPLPPADREVAWLAEGEQAPSWATVLVSIEGDRLRIVASGETSWGPLPLVSAAAADATARRIAARASTTAIPASVSWGELPAPHTGGLGVRLGMGERGPVVLDLVADGPHVLVAGTTVAGKSEALRTIIGSLAHDFSPSQVQFALIDFKGGAGLGACAALPHVASVLTDLEPHLARRCLLALGAELASRKRAIASASASSYDEWGEGRPARLVVVVDEFQEIAAVDRDFLPQLARLAAQGRSLGIHLLLATQRPAGTVGAEIRANISATLALRTASDADSRDLIGTGQAALISPQLPGRALLARGTAVEEVQVALPLADAPAPIRLAGRGAPQGRSLLDLHAAGQRAAPLWLPPLPEQIAPAEEGAFVLGVADLPAQRARAPLAWDPAAGPLVVTGPPRSGKTAALAAVAARAAALGLTAVAVPQSPRLAVRTLALLRERTDVLVVIDDAARTLAAASMADPEAPELLAHVVQHLPTALAVPPGWAHHRLTAAAGLRLVLTGLAAEDDAAWDIPRELRQLPPVPGRARAGDAAAWREAQLARSTPWEPAPLAAELPVACPAVPPDALGVGGDDGAPVLLPRTLAAVVGPPGDDRESVARRVALVTGLQPLVTEAAFTLGMPGQESPRVIVVTRPTARALRDVARGMPAGLIDPQPPRLRCVAIIDGEALAVQVLDA